MGYILFIVYIILLSWLLTRIRFIRNSGLSPKIIVLLFCLKVFAGMIGGRIFQDNDQSDTWRFHEDGLKEYHLLFSNPKEYVTDIFYTGYKNGYEGILQPNNSYWNDLKTNLMVKIVSVLDIFSGGYYYVNVILYNFLIFLGYIALFRVFSQVYKEQPNILVITCFLLPSLLLFGSMIHKEGIMFAALGMIVFCVYQAFYFSDITLGKSIVTILSLLLVLLIRNFIVIALIPALLAWIISHKNKYPAIWVFSIVYILFIAIAFIIPHFISSIDLPGALVQKQVEFLHLEKARSYVDIHLPDAGFKSYITNAPLAMEHSLLRPFITDYTLSPLLLPFGLEILLYQLIFLLFLVFRKGVIKDWSFTLFCVFFSFSVLLIIGYTVPVIWAITRYRSIYLPFILTPFICSIDWKRMLVFIKIKK